MEITIQPLVTALKGKNFYFRLSQNDDGNYILELGTKIKSRGLSERRVKLIAGNELTVPEVTYTITSDSYTCTGAPSPTISTQLPEVNKLVQNVFKFRDTHHVTSWRD